jgi:hypothetical protein
MYITNIYIQDRVALSQRYVQHLQNLTHMSKEEMVLSQRIGNQAFMNYVEASVSHATTIINNCDPIPSIPPSALTGCVP